MTRRDKIAVATVVGGFTAFFCILIGVLVFLIGPAGFLPAFIAGICSLAITGKR